MAPISHLWEDLTSYGEQDWNPTGLLGPRPLPRWGVKSIDKYYRGKIPNGISGLEDRPIDEAVQLALPLCYQQYRQRRRTLVGVDHSWRYNRHYETNPLACRNLSTRADKKSDCICIHDNSGHVQALEYHQDDLASVGQQGIKLDESCKEN